MRQRYTEFQEAAISAILEAMNSMENGKPQAVASAVRGVHGTDDNKYRILLIRADAMQDVADYLNTRYDNKPHSAVPK